MFNILLDELPEEWNGYPIDSDFQIGIQISQCLEDPALTDAEKLDTAADLLFVDESNRPYGMEAVQGIQWFLNEFNHDHMTGKGRQDPKVMDFDMDQWRIYSAFRHQYGIDLNREKLHWFVFMGLLSSLDDCALTRVIEYRQKKITAKMSGEEKKQIQEIKKKYAIRPVQEEEELTEEEKTAEAEAVAAFNRLRNKA